MVYYRLFGDFLSQQTTIFKYPSIGNFATGSIFSRACHCLVHILTGSLRIICVCNDWPYTYYFCLRFVRVHEYYNFSYKILTQFQKRLHLIRIYLQVLAEESPPLFYGEDSVPARHQESHILLSLLHKSQDFMKKTLYNFHKDLFGGLAVRLISLMKAKLSIFM